MPIVLWQRIHWKVKDFFADCTCSMPDWENLTRFLQIAGAPLDNNLVERALKLFIRQRKNSLFYKSEYSAYIAGVLTSLIVTCIYAGVNVIDYFVALQEHRSEVFADPEAWLPWTYQASLVPP